MNTFVSPRLYWACRRGMLELDVLLGNFLAEAYPHLSTTEQKNFVSLLECNDQELFMWLTDKEKSSDPILASMVQKVRQHAKSRKPASSV